MVAKRWKGVPVGHILSSGGSDSEPKGCGWRFHDSSRPLKRHVLDDQPLIPRKCQKDQEPSCSYWDNRELPLDTELPVAHKHVMGSVRSVVPDIPGPPALIQ